MEEMDRPNSLDSNKRKYNNSMGGERTVVAVKIEEGNGKKQRLEADCWSWRKYGQKPIKGSPYPRGYYRCSTSKNCSAKKQVERCKTDATTLIITYTCAHNHPEPPDDIHKQEPEGTPKQEPESYKHEQETPPLVEATSVEESPFAAETTTTTSVLIYNEDVQLRPSVPLDFSELKTDHENDFYDELEELPTSSFFTAFMRSDFCDRRILLNPS